MYASGFRLEKEGGLEKEQKKKDENRETKMWGKEIEKKEGRRKYRYYKLERGGGSTLASRGHYRTFLASAPSLSTR